MDSKTCWLCTEDINDNQPYWMTPAVHGSNGESEVLMHISCCDILVKAVVEAPIIMAEGVIWKARREAQG